MSEQERNLAIAREGLAEFRRGDIEAFRQKLDPEVEIYSPPDRANPAHFSGRDGFLRWTSTWLDAWERFELEAEDFEPVGEHTVLATVMQRGVGKGSGVEVQMRAYYMLEYRDGLATRVHLYPDREPALEAALEWEKGEGNRRLARPPQQPAPE